MEDVTLADDSVHQITVPWGGQSSIYQVVHDVSEMEAKWMVLLTKLHQSNWFNMFVSLALNVDCFFAYSNYKNKYLSETGFPLVLKVDKEKLRPYIVRRF